MKLNIKKLLDIMVSAVEEIENSKDEARAAAILKTKELVKSSREFFAQEKVFDTAAPVADNIIKFLMAQNFRAFLLYKVDPEDILYDPEKIASFNSMNEVLNGPWHFEAALYPENLFRVNPPEVVVLRSSGATYEECVVNALKIYNNAVREYRKKKEDEGLGKI